jgi:hypothetical protein
VRNKTSLHIEAVSNTETCDHTQQFDFFKLLSDRCVCVSVMSEFVSIFHRRLLCPSQISILVFKINNVFLYVFHNTIF